jgi:hypothetical protein
MLSHGLVIGTPGSHSSTSSSTSTPPSAQQTLEPRVSVFPFLTVVLSFGGLPFAFLVIQLRAAFGSPNFYVVRVSLLF